MPSKKRQRDDDAPSASEHVHASRKRRLEYGEADAALAKIYNDLRDELPSIRSEATVQLLRNLLTAPTEDSANATSTSPSSRIDTAINRLIKGTCSGAKAARLGFSMALAEVLRLKFNSRSGAAHDSSDRKSNGNDARSAGTGSIDALIQDIVSSSIPEGKVSGEERRNSLLGRRFALQAVLQSGILAGRSPREARVVFEALADLAALKAWLRADCGAVLKRALLEEGSGEEKKKGQDEGRETTARLVLETWAAKGLLKSPEGVALWLAIKRRYAEVKLPKGCWHHNNPLAAQERAGLTKILLKNAVDVDDDANGQLKTSGARQSAPSFAWETILAEFFESGDKQEFVRFWADCVASPMFSTSSSTERKALGLQIFTLAVKRAPNSMVEDTLHPNIIKCIVDQRAKPDRMLFEATKQPLEQLSARVKSTPESAGQVFGKLMQYVPSNLDKQTKACLETISSCISTEDLTQVVSEALSLCKNPKLADTKEVESKRRLITDLLLQLVRSRRKSSEALFNISEDINSGSASLHPWLASLLRALTKLAFLQLDNTVSPTITESSRVMLQERLTSILGDLMDQPIHLAGLAPTLVAKELKAAQKDLVKGVSDETRKVLDRAFKMQQRRNVARQQDSAGGVGSNLLLALVALQVYKQEPDSEAILSDIVAMYEDDGDDVEAQTSLVEMLLSFVTKQSALFRKLAEQVFTALAPDLSPDGLQSLIDVLSQKESLAGQQELFQNGDDADDAEEEEEEDVEEFSDVELVNGMVVSARKGSADEETSEDESSDSESEVEEGDEENDDDDDSSDDSDDSDGSDDVVSTAEDNAVERDIAKALGAAGLNEDSETDGSDMDDDQMLEVDKALVTVLTEHKKLANKKKDKRDARENIVNFKNRVCDLLMIYVKSQYANLTALNLIHPLVALTRTTSSGVTAKKALDVLEQLFASCKKHKSIPILEDDGDDDCLLILREVHNEMRLGGSKLHASAGSKSSQFLAKILVSADADNWEKVALLYVQLQKEWRNDPKSKIPVSVFNDWHGWCLVR